MPTPARRLFHLAKADTKKERAKLLSKIAKSADWDLYVISTLVRLAPQDTVCLNASMLGKRVSYGATHYGDSFESTRPNLHGH